jgi:hypothetical protein
VRTLLWSGFVEPAVAEDADRLTVTFKPGYSDPGPLRMEAWIHLGDTRPVTIYWRSDPLVLGSAAEQETYTVDLDLPPLPAEDYSVGVAIFCEGRRTMTGAVAYRLHRGTRISASSVFDLDDVALRIDLESGVIDKAEWSERLRELQRRRHAIAEARSAPRP